MKLKPVVASLVMLGLMAPAFAKSSMASREAVINQNSVTSPVSSEGWFNRISIGGVGSVLGMYGNHDFPGTFTTAGAGSDLYINNLNLIAKADLCSWSKATVNLAYFGSPRMWSDGGFTLAAAGNLDANYSARFVYNIVAVDEAYLTLGDLVKYPVYAKIGKTYVPFGEFKCPYTPYQIMSPAQMLAQTNAVSAIFGASTDFGMYASVYAFRGYTMPVSSDTGHIRNFGAKLGYYNNLDQFSMPGVKLNVNVSYLRNVWDTEVFNPSSEPKHITGSDKQVDPVGGIAGHIDIAYKGFSLFANWTGTLKDMVPAAYARNENSKFWGADVNADYAFKTFDRDSHFGAGVQFSGNGKWFGNVDATIANLPSALPAGNVTDWARVVPKLGFVVNYGVNIFKNTDLNFVYANRKSYDFASLGQGSRRTNIGIASLNFKF